MTAFTWKSDDTSDLERSSKRGKQYLEDDLAGSNGVAKTSDGSSTDDVVCRALMAARYEDKVYALFDEIDIDQKGAIDGCDLQHFFVHSLKKRGIKMDIRVVALAVKTLLTNQNEPPRRPHINRCEFLSIFIEQEAFRKVICASDPECSQDKGQNCADVENGIRLGQATKNAEVHWKNSNRIWLWIIIYSTICLLVFITAAIHSAQHDEATEVFGNCFIVARASAKAINFHAMLVLLPITRQLTTFTRNSKLRWVLLPLEALHNVHAFLGIVLGIFTTIHVLAHASNYTRFIAADQEDILALFEDRVDELPPTDGKGRLLWALRQRATITGVVILLLILSMILLCYHGTGNLFGNFQTVYWVLVPLSLYLVPRVFREIKCTSATVTHAESMENVVCLRLKKPPHWSMIQKPGMYAMLNVPSISRFEWHPFTISSSPHQDEIEFHIQAVGDWTKRLHSLLQTSISAGDLKVRIEGPVGAPSQAYKDYPVVVLIGAGIGVTPMISVVRSLLVNPGRVKKAYFYWTKRESSKIFSDLMQKIYESDTQKLIEIRHFVTAAKPDDRNLGEVLFHLAANSIHAESDMDIFLGYRTHNCQIGVGRPNWSTELSHAVQTTERLGENKCGVFLCGPDGMAKQVQKESLALSRTTKNGVHVFFSKEVF